MTTLRTCIIAIAIFGMFTAAQCARADSGTYESTYSFVTNYASMPYQDGTVTGGASKGVAVITESDSPLFAKGVGRTQECVIFARRTAAGLNLDAACNMTDADGDKIFTMAKRTAGDAAQGSSAGTSQITGGTGKYSGIKGSCTYTVQFLPDNRAIAPGKCQWQRP